MQSDPLSIRSGAWASTPYPQGDATCPNRLTCAPRTVKMCLMRQILVFLMFLFLAPKAAPIYVAGLVVL